ncbi:MAG: hypothetical protein PHU63_02030 [Candidatus ainarchaeum sp.]|nr:hypothetical protein [Candidatus ainarchaeum sp.]
MKLRNTQQQKKTKIPFKVAVARAFRGKICYTYIYYLVENKLSRELKELVESIKDDKEKLNRLDLILYQILSDYADIVITPEVRSFGLSMRAKVMEYALQR